MCHSCTFSILFLLSSPKTQNYNFVAEERESREGRLHEFRKLMIVRFPVFAARIFISSILVAKLCEIERGSRTNSKETRETLSRSVDMIFFLIFDRIRRNTEQKMNKRAKNL